MHTELCTRQSCPELDLSSCAWSSQYHSYDGGKLHDYCITVKILEVASFPGSHFRNENLGTRLVAMWTWQWLWLKVQFLEEGLTLEPGHKYITVQIKKEATFPTSAPKQQGMGQTCTWRQRWIQGRYVITSRPYLSQSIFLICHTISSTNHRSRTHVSRIAWFNLLTQRDTAEIGCRYLTYMVLDYHSRVNKSCCNSQIPLYSEPDIQSNSTIIESVDSICRDSADTQYMLIQTNSSKSPKQLTYKPL